MADPWEKYGGQGGSQRIQTKPADPTIADKRTISRNQAEASAYDPAKAALDNRAAELRIQQIEAEIEREREKAAQSAAVNKDLDDRRTRIATIKALADQLVEVEQIYNRNFRGGVPNFIAGRVQPAEADELKKAAAGLLDVGQAAFRVPNSGDQNASELQFKLDAYLPSATGTDAGNTQNFNYLRRRINGALEALGEPAIDFEQRVNPKQAEQPQDSILNPAAGRAATKSETSALEPGQRFAYDEAGQPIGILDAQGNWVSGYSEIVGGNQDERDDAARDTIMGGIDAFGRGLVDWPTLGNAEKVSAFLNTLSNRRDGESFSDAYWRNMDMENRTNAADERVNPWARLGGQLGGVFLGGYGAARSFPGAFRGDLAAFSGRGMALDAATGAGYGASKAIDQGDDPLAAAASGGTFGTLGGIGGRGGANIIGRGVSGVTNPEIRRLYDAGIPLTPGQMVSQSGAGLLPFGDNLGTIAKGFEDVADGMGPLSVGVRANRMNSLEGFNRAAFREGGFPVADIAEKGIGQAKGVRRAAYGDALDNRTVAADLPFVQNVNDIAKASDNIKGMEGMFRDTLADRVGSQFDKGSRSMTGRGMQAAIRGLKADARKADASNNYMRSDQFGDAATRTEAELLALADRQNPGMAQAYKDANALNMRLSVLKDAVRAGKQTEGIFTPAQLGASSDKIAEKFGKAGGTTARPFFDLQRTAQNVLPSKIPDSGTAGRAASLAMPYLLAGGAQSGFVPGLETGSTEANALAAAALLMSNAGRKATEKALLARTPKLRNAGKAIRKRSGLFGAAAAPLPILISE